MRAINPISHHGRHGTHFLIAVLQAEQHGSQFLFGQIPLIEISHLAAPEQHEKITLRDLLCLGGIVFFTSTCARKIKQIGVIEKIEGLFFKLELQFGNHRCQYSTRQFSPSTHAGGNRHQITIPLAEQ